MSALGTGLKDEAREWVTRIRAAVASQERPPTSTRGADGAKRTGGAVRARGSLSPSKSGQPLPSLDGLLRELRTRHVPCRLEVAHALGLAREDEVVAALDRLTADPSPSVRFAAVDALGRIGGTEATQALLSAIERDPNDAVRTQAVAAVGMLILGDYRNTMEGPGKGHTSPLPRAESEHLDLASLANSLSRIALEDRSHEVREATREVLSVLAGSLSETGHPGAP